jgi:hypothetical protein
MNDTQFILYLIFSFAIGHAIGWATLNIGVKWREWGPLLSVIIFFPAIGMTLGFLAMHIAVQDDPILSTLFVIGFIYKMWKGR